MNNQLAVDLINRASFGRNDVISYYSASGSLHPAEKVIFDKLRGSLRGAKILDIGVGGGRTTHYLSQISPHYVGIDYVQRFADETSLKYPLTKILCMDATDLSPFPDESFDFVLFSYNGLGCISPDSRLKALKEIHRVLKKGGHFMFSAHNREYKYFRKPPWRRKIELDVQFFKFLLYSFYHLPRHWAMKKHEVDTDEYSLVNDSDHRYSLLFYYISPEKQIKQLEKFGFTDVEVYDKRGRKVSGCEYSPWLEYLTVKA